MCAPREDLPAQSPQVEITKPIMSKAHMSIESTAGAAAIKFFGVTVIIGAAATALGFLFLWPKSVREAFVRFACAIFSSFTLGPLLAFAARAQIPGVFDSAQQIGKLYGDPLAGLLIAAAPFFALSALPAWWLFGWIYRWMDVRRDKDIGQVAQDAADLVKEVKGGIL